MTNNTNELKRRVREYAKENDRASQFSDDELVQIALEAERVKAKIGGNFIQIFDQLVFERSFEKGMPKNPSS